MRSLLLCLLLVQTMLFCQGQKPSLRVLIVHDTSTTDIQVASMADMIRVKKAFTYIAGQTGLRFQPTVIKGNELTKQTLKAWLKTIHSCSKDVVLFYYSGRGSNTHNSKWPSIAFGKRANLSEVEVTRYIKARGPKLGVVIFDCYSRPVALIDNVDFKFIDDFEVTKPGRRPGLKNIFRANKGIIMGCSGSDVEKAYCSMHLQPIGGLFTTNFLKGLFAYSGAYRADWNNVIMRVGSLSRNAHIMQTPIFKKNTSNPYGSNIKSSVFSSVEGGQR
jgi:hypothetical protein